MRRWDFDHFVLSKDLTAYIVSCFNHFELASKFSVGGHCMEATCQAIREMYSEKAVYHNWSHAFATFHATFLLLDNPAFFEVLPKEDMLALLFAALGHDVEHPGFNNTFLMESMNPLALRYNDQSVLENHHASMTCSVLWRPADSEQDRPAGPMVSLERLVSKRAREVVIKAILGTDMTKHAQIIKELESSDFDLKGVRSKFTRLEGATAMQLDIVLLHCADLVHPVMPWAIHKKMSLRMAQEFYTQFQEEERLGLPTLPFMGKNPECLSGLAPVQTGFLQYVVRPLWLALNGAAGEDDKGERPLEAVVENLEHNSKMWQQLADGQDVADEQPFKHPPISEDPLADA
jgi:hypothetical protein